MAGVFQVACTAAAGVALPELHTAVRNTIAEIVRNGPTEIELERALISSEANFIYRLQTIGGFGGKGDQLNAYNVYRGDPGYFDADRKRYRDVTAAGVAAAARRFLVEPPLVTLSVVPRGRRELALPGATEVSVS
jgi:zinc protease